MRAGASGNGAAIPRTLADHTQPMDTPGRIAELERKFAENPRRYFAALANEFRKHGELDRAIELCESHLAEQRNHLSGHVVLAQALVDAGRESDAWDPLHTALDLDPENFIALRLIGELSAKVGDIEHARTFYFRALEIEPRNEQLLTAVKNLSQRPAVPVAEATEQATAAAPAPEARVPGGDSWGDVTPLPGLESSTAFEAVEAAEPVAEEPPAADMIEPTPSPEAHAEELLEERRAAIEAAAEPEAAARREMGAEQEAATRPAEETKPAVEEPRAIEPPAREPVAEEPEAGATVEVTPAHGDPFSDWLPSADSHVEPTPEEDWMSAAGSVAAESDSDWDTGPARDEQRSKTYDYHDWQPPLTSDTVVTSDTRGEAPQEPATDAASESADEVQPVADEVQPVADEVQLVAGEPVLAGPVASPAGAESVEARPMLVSETMADLYLQQGHVSLAVEVLRELVASRPDDERLQAKLAEVGRPAAAPPRETVRDMFARFARTAQPLRERARPGSTVRRSAGGAEQAGPIGNFFREGGTGSGDAGATALLAMVAPTDPAPAEDDALERWLGGPRQP